MEGSDGNFEKQEVLVIDGSTLNAEILLKACATPALRIELADGARDLILSSYQELQKSLSSGVKVYGLSTACGALDSKLMDISSTAESQYELLRSHASGIGDNLSQHFVRGIIILRINTFAAGLSAVRIEVVDALLRLLNSSVIPAVPSRGSVGVSDLAALAHIGCTLFGEGSCYYDGELLPAGDAFKKAGIDPIELGGRDGLALINGLDQSITQGNIVSAQVGSLIDLAEQVAALTLIACGSDLSFLDKRLVELMATEEEQLSAQKLANFTKEAKPLKSEWRTPLSLRCTPQLFGANRRAHRNAADVVSRLVSTAIDNPILFPDGPVINNNGSMHGQVLSEAFDALCTSIINLGIASHRRITQLIQSKPTNDLPPFLAENESGIGQHGLMMARYSATSTVAALRGRALPDSIQSMPVAGMMEDHSSMCLNSVQRCQDLLESVQELIAIELMGAVRAAQLTEREVPGASSELFRQGAKLMENNPTPGGLSDTIKNYILYVRDRAATKQ